MVDTCEHASKGVSICWLDTEPQNSADPVSVITRFCPKDDPILLDAVDLPSSDLRRMVEQQSFLI